MKVEYENSHLGNNVPSNFIFLSCTTLIGNNASLIATVDVEITIHLQSPVSSQLLENQINVNPDKHFIPTMEIPRHRGNNRAAT